MQPWPAVQCGGRRALRAPDVQAAIDRVTQVCHDAGVRLGIFGVSAAALQPYLARDYTLLVAGVDTLLLAQAAQAMLTELKA